VRDGGGGGGFGGARFRCRGSLFLVGEKKAYNGNLVKEEGGRGKNRVLVACDPTVQTDGVLDVA